MRSLITILCFTIATQSWAQDATSPNSTDSVEKPVRRERVVRRTKVIKKVKAPESEGTTDALKVPAAPEANGDLLSGLDYPELNVVPRASERLQIEAQREGTSGWLSFWTFNVSALSTLYSGMALSGDYKNDNATTRNNLDLMTKTATSIGVAWLALTTYYSFTRPYVKEYDRIKKIKGSDKRADLTRERFAEEALESSARLVKIFTWMSVVTNFAVNAAMIEQSTSDNNIYPIIGMLTSTLPLIFTNRYIDNYEKHQEYKRKIYAPVAFVDFRSNIHTAKVDPYVMLNWSF